MVLLNNNLNVIINFHWRVFPIHFITTELVNRYSRDQTTKTSSLNEPPKSGFVPRTPQDHGISHREAIRCSPSSPFVATQWPHPTLMKSASHPFNQCSAIDCVQFNSHEASQEKIMYEPRTTASNSGDSIHFMGQSNSPSHTLSIPSHDIASFIPGRIRQNVPYTFPCYAPSHLTGQTEADNGVHRPLQSTGQMDNVSNLQFDILRSEPQLVIS